MTPRFRLANAMLLSLGLSWQLAGHAAPLTDRLERAARFTALARSSALTAVQNVGERQVMVGSNGHILLRDSKGDVHQVPVPVDVLLTAVHFPDARQGWAVGHDGVVLHSTDGGLSWSKQLDGVQINQRMLDSAQAEFVKARRASDDAPADRALIEQLDAAQFALDDVKAGNLSGPSRPLLDVWFRNAREGWIVGAYGMILHTRDGGLNWAWQPGLDNPDRLHLNTVTGLPDGTLLVAGEGGQLHRSTDGGQHWDAPRQLTQASVYKLLALRDGRVLALGFGGALQLGTNSGISWNTPTPSSAASLYGATQLEDGAIVVAGQGGSLLYSRDGEHFSTWRASNKAALLGVTQTRNGELLLVGNNGVQALALDTLKEQLQ